jgi:Ca2+/Na+ antiporter
METVGILFVLGFCLFMFFLIKYGVGSENKMKKKIIDTENSLQQEGFIISRKVGDHNLWDGALGYYLYVDDVNKKWFMTSYYSPEIGKIRRYDDLLDYDFFDIDARDVTGKIIKGMVATTTAIGGSAVGGLLGRGVLGGVIGGVVGSKATKIILGTKGKSSSYGFVVKTKDCNINNPELIFDFCNIILHSRIGNITKRELNRSDEKYKRDIAAIQEMANIFDYIIRSNVQ